MVQKTTKEALKTPTLTYLNTKSVSVNMIFFYNLLKFLKMTDFELKKDDVFISNGYQYKN